MTDSRDQPDLETLDYKPKYKKSILICPKCKKTFPLFMRREFNGHIDYCPTQQECAMGFNSIVIKPETRVNKAEDAGQHLQESLCRETEPEQPNQNLMIIEEIEGLISQANEKMYDLPIHPIRSQAIEEIDILSRITIKKQLREAFE